MGAPFPEGTKGWGYNLYGQIGDGTTRTRYTPVLVPGLAQVVHLAAGTLHSLAVTADGTVWAWGNAQGTLGDGTTTQRLSPVTVVGLPQ
jgi:alpha-tubulin suppressor-like RCC1 family protein